GSESDALIQQIAFLDGVKFVGLHIYDGHLHQPSLEQRQADAGQIIVDVRKYAQRYPEVEIVGGGSPTFGIWAGQTDWQCSPGTTVFWDVGYANAFPELEFEIAAALVTRVVSKPGNGQICLDLGYKAISSEMPLERRVVLPKIDDAKFVSHSEEHLVVATEQTDDFHVGDALIAFPQHICPTVADHGFATVVRWGNATDEKWPVTARDR
ncbi:MAG: D-TA family PLP-dependent enzyme, partial [Pirellulaceae bacterium]|nr:D-TA family PLP-dependent enzyme [Pirellulaceae bacterium]